MITDAETPRWPRRPATVPALTGPLLPAPAAEAWDEDEPPIQDLFKTDLVFPQARGVAP